MRIQFSFLLLPILLLISSSNITAQFSKPTSSIIWDDIKRISYDSASSYVPQIVAQGDTLHLIWFGVFNNAQPDSGGGIQYARSTNSGVTFSPQRRLVPDDSSGARRHLKVSGQNVYVVYDALVQPSPSPYWEAAIIRSTDAGLTWNPRKIIGDYTAVTAITKDSNIFVHAGFVENNIYKNAMLLSHDFGVTWDIVRIQLPRGPNIARMALTTNALNLIRTIGISGYEEVFYNRSTDFGYTWSVAETLSVNDGQNGSNPRFVSEGNSLFTVWNDQKYGGNFSGTIVLRRSTDEGITWQPEQIISQLNTAVFCDVAVENNLVAVVWDNDYTIPLLYSLRVRISEDAGITFGQVMEITSDSAHAGDPTICIANNKIHIAWWDQKDNEVYYRRGVFQPTSVKEELTVPSEFTLYQNYPNPFNNSTVISYSIPRREVISLKIYDALGRIVTTLFEGEQEGMHTVNFSANNLSSGIYFVVLRTEIGMHRERKVILLK